MLVDDPQKSTQQFTSKRLALNRLSICLMTERLFISPLAEITTLDDDKIALSVVGRRYTIEDKIGLTRRILDFAQHGMTSSTLIDSLSNEFSETVLASTIQSLTATGVLVSKDDRAMGESTHLHLQHYRERSGNPEGRPLEQYDPARWRVALVGKGMLANALKLAIADVQIEVECVDDALSTVSDKRCVILTVSDDENIALARAWNKTAVILGLPFLFVGIDWSVVQCGPLVLPRATACYECYYHRVRATRRFVNEFDALSDRSRILYNKLPSKLAIQWAVAETLRLLLLHLSGTHDQLHQSPFSTIDTFQGSIERSMVLRLPRCPVCGNASGEKPVSAVYQHAQLRRGSGVSRV